MGDTGPAGIPVVPLVWDDLPCVALPMAHLDAVDSMTSGRAAFAVTLPTAGGDTLKTRKTGDKDEEVSGGTGGGAGGGTLAAGGLVATGPVDIRYDLQGKRFADHLIEQEIVKHPPTRLRADGLMARRENWWWLPRVLITMTALEEVRELPGRTRSEDALLVRPHGPHGSAPRVDTVTARTWPGDPGGGVELWRRDGAALQGGGEPAFAFSHRHSPDFERWERWYRTGRVQGEVLSVSESEGAPEQEQPRPYGLLARFRNHREVVRSCREGISRAESRTAGEE
ncbi:hypothetical protein [Streptomonospora sediminis]